MPSVELLTLIALALGVPLTIVLCAVALLVYPQTRLLLSDILKLFAFAGRWVRKAAIASEVEGSVNSFVQYYNEAANDLVLPQCRVEWVTAENHAQTVLPGTVVVRVSLDRDHDRNFYNTATTFVAHAFLQRTKPFLTKATARGIDLAMVHGILSRARRAALRIFNEHFVDVGPEVEKVYYALEEIDEEGLLHRLLIREFHQLGESLGDRAPREEYAAEADKFLGWLHRLVLRDPGEQYQLHFAGTLIKVGLILIAKDETFLQHGIEPYLRRALYYANRGFTSVYLLSRGARRGDLLKRIAMELENLGGFEILTKRFDIPVGDPQSNEFITCLQLKIDPIALIQTAWDRLRRAKADGVAVYGTVLRVSPTQIDVDVYGLQTSLGSSAMSGMVVPDATRYFQPGDELKLNIIEVDAGRNRLALSNVGTESDPKTVVDAFASSADQVVDASVVHFALKDGFEVGMRVALEGTTTPGWIPRSKARCGSFVGLSDKFPVGSKLPVKVLSFQPQHNNWVCEAHGRPDPWNEVSGYQIGRAYDVTVREIGERHVVCELVDGAEAVVYQNEIVWGGEAERTQAILALQPGQVTAAVLLELDVPKRFARLSLKRVTRSAAEVYFESVRDRVISAKVVEIGDNRARLGVEDQECSLILPIREVVWGYCDSLEHLIQVGATVKVVPFAYQAGSDTITVSAKRARPNEFEAVREQVAEGAVVQAEVVIVGRDSVYTNSLIDGRPVAGYIHKSQISNLIFVTPETLAVLMPSGSRCSVIVQRRDDNNRILELSRRAWLQQSLPSLEYGNTYRGTLHALPDGRHLFYSDELEALVRPARMGRGPAAKELEVSIARKGATPRDLEIELEGGKRQRSRRRW